MEVWWFTTIGHSVLLVGYAWIAAILFLGNSRARQWHVNPLATATFLIFFSCAIGHGLHVFHAFETTLGIQSSSTAAAQIAMSDPLLMVWSIATAGVAVWYLTLRGRLRLVSAAGICDDLSERQDRAQALRAPIHELIEQAEASLAAGDDEAAVAAIDEALAASRHMITELIGDDDRLRIRAGDLRRRSAA